MTTHTTSLPTASPTAAVRTGLRSLPTVLRLDAAVTGLNAVAYVALAPVLDDLLGLPATGLRATGAFLVVYAVAVAVVGWRRPVPGPAAWAVVAANEAWVVGSIIVAVAGTGSPSTLGTVWLVAQAAVVAAFAMLQVQALRRA